jgi:hypothetical protein
MPAQDARRGPVSLRFPRPIRSKMNDSVFILTLPLGQCVQGSLTWQLKRKKSSFDHTNFIS